MVKEKNGENTVEESEFRRREIKFNHIIVIFMIGCVLGVILEGLFCLCFKKHWESHVTFLWGPFNIVYGGGAALMYVISVFLEKKNAFVNFLCFAAMGTAVEWIAGYVQEHFLNSTSWSYGRLVIGKYISIPFTIMWGLLGMVFIYLLYPLLKKLLDKIHGRAWDIICRAVCVFMCVNLVVSAFVLVRWGQRKAEPVASNRVEQFIDDHYSSDYLQDRFVEWKML